MALQGLSESEVSARRQQGLGNNVRLSTSRSYADILRQNVLTFIDIVLFTIGVVLISVGRVGDAVVSVGLILMNIVIGVYQEARASEALEAALPGAAQKLVDEVPFSSALKWSAIACDSDELRGIYVLGALEMLQPYLQAGIDLAEQVRQHSDVGLRVLVFAHNPDVKTLHDSQNQPRLPQNQTVLGWITFTDELRPDAGATLSGFARAGIRLKIISGDNPHTVAALAKQAGLLLVIFVEPPIPFFTGGDELSGDFRPTILAGGMLLLFFLILRIPPARDFFEILVLPLNLYLIIAAGVLIWGFGVREVWRRRFFDRFLNIDLSAV